MKDATWRLTGDPFGQGHTTGLGSRGGKSSRTSVMRSLGAVVYAARLADGTIKIGHTQRFDLRLHWLKCHVQQNVELLAFRVGTHAEEQAIHASLAAHRAHGREYYHPSLEVLAVVNGMREDLHLPHIA